MITNYEPKMKFSTDCCSTSNGDHAIPVLEEKQTIQKLTTYTYTNLCTIHAMLDNIDRLLIGVSERKSDEIPVPTSLRCNCDINLELSSSAITRLRDISILLGVDE